MTRRRPAAPPSAAPSSVTRSRADSTSRVAGPTRRVAVRFRGDAPRPRETHSRASAAAGKTNTAPVLLQPRHVGGPRCDGAGLAEIMVAGRWRSPKMPAYVARCEYRGCGAVATHYRNRNGRDGAWILRMGRPLAGETRGVAVRALRLRFPPFGAISPLFRNAGIRCPSTATWFNLEDSLPRFTSSPPCHFGRLPFWQVQATRQRGPSIWAPLRSPTRTAESYVSSGGRMLR